VNLGVAKIGSHLLGLKSVGVRHGDGTEGCDIGERYYLTEKAPKRSIVGEFTREDGGAAVIVVNDDMKIGVSIPLKVAPRFKSYRPVSRVSGQPGGSRPLSDGEGGKAINVLLQPGDGALIYLDTE
jgi:hypothetical protein